MARPRLGYPLSGAGHWPLEALAAQKTDTHQREPQPVMEKGLEYETGETAEGRQRKQKKKRKKTRRSETQRFPLFHQTTRGKKQLIPTWLHTQNPEMQLAIISCREQ